MTPSTDDKYVTLPFGKPVRTYQDRNGVTKPVFEYPPFIDSYRFMATSLHKLVSYLPQDKFEILDKVFPDYSKEERNLLLQKGYYPYSYFDNFKKFKEEKSPPREQWKDSLRIGEVMITEDQWQYEQFQCANLGDYHNLYLLPDTILLACMAKEFPYLCYTTNGLDSANGFTCFHISGDAFLTIYRTDIELLTDRPHFERVENMIVGSVSSVFDKRLFKANIIYLDDHNNGDYDTWCITGHKQFLWRCHGKTTTATKQSRNYSKP